MEGWKDENMEAWKRGERGAAAPAWAGRGRGERLLPREGAGRAEGVRRPRPHRARSRLRRPFAPFAAEAPQR